MSALLSDEEITRLVQVIRSSNVRDTSYQEAEGAIVRHGPAARPILVTLLSDPEKLVRDRATELLEKLG